MKATADKPAVVAALPFALGVFAGYYLRPTSGLVWLICLMLGAAALVAHFFRRHGLFAIAAATAWAAAGATAVSLALREPPPDDLCRFADLPLPTAVEGVIVSPAERLNRRTEAVLQADSVWIAGRGYRASGRCLLKIFEPVRGLDYGDRIVVRGKLRLPAGERNPGDFDYRKHLAVQGIRSIFMVPSADQVVLLNRSEGNPVMRRAVSPVRRFAADFIDRRIGGREGALLKGLMLGARGDIDPELREAFADVGVIHVLAVSGLHVGFVAALLVGILRFVRCPEPWRTIAAVAALFFYALITGLKPPVFRASVMAAVFLTGRLLQRPTSMINTISIALLVLLIIQPLQLFEVGFQLSFAAVLGIVLFYRRFETLFRRPSALWRDAGRTWPAGVISLAAVSAAAQAATLPLTAYYFNRLPLYALPANLLVVPTVQIIVSLGFLAIMLRALLPTLGACAAEVLRFALSALIRLVTAFDRLPYASIIVARPPLLLTAALLFAMAAFLLWENRRLRSASVCGLLLMLNLHLWTTVLAPRKGLEVTFLDVGQGDAALLRFPGGRTLLVDAGDCSEFFDAGRDVIVPFLRRHGIRQVHTLLLTHPHADHIGGAPALLQKGMVRRLVWNDDPSPDPAAARLDSLLAAVPLTVRRVCAGDTLLLDREALLLVLNPPKDASRLGNNLNDRSIVLLCLFRGSALLLTGDAEKEAERAMSRYGPLLKVDILKAGHHGSATASSSDFRRLTAARWAVVSVAKNNRFGLPSKPLLREFAAEGTTVLRTDENGAVQFLLREEKVLRVR